MRFRIDLKIFLFLIIFYITKQIEIYAIMIGFAILHELGHLFMGLLLGLKPEKIDLIPMGLAVSFKVNISDFNKKKKRGNVEVLKEIFIAIAGPVVNLIILILALIFIKDEMLKKLIVYANLLIFMFNLLPIYPLDGGRILNGILHIFVGKREAMKLSYNISMIITIIVTAIASIGILYYKNIAIFFIVMYLWVIVLKEAFIYRKIENLYKEVNNNLNGSGEF